MYPAGYAAGRLTPTPGSPFTIRLPAHPAEHAQDAGVDLSRPLVLVVDDNPGAAEILGRHLAVGGFRMAIARSGTDALKMARALKPVAVTLDILLPEIDGWDVLTRLKEDEGTRNIPVVVVSVVDNPALGRALGAIDYFVKPVDGKALLSRLEQYTFTSKARSSEVRVLVIEDERKVLRALERGLENEGYQVIAAANGETGFRLALDHPFDCIILDLLLPGKESNQGIVQLRRLDWLMQEGGKLHTTRIDIAPP